MGGADSALPRLKTFQGTTWKTSPYRSVAGVVKHSRFFLAVKQLTPALWLASSYLRGALQEHLSQRFQAAANFATVDAADQMIRVQLRKLRDVEQDWAAARRRLSAAERTALQEILFAPSAAAPAPAGTGAKEACFAIVPALDPPPAAAPSPAAPAAPPVALRSCSYVDPLPQKEAQSFCDGSQLLRAERVRQARSGSKIKTSPFYVMQRS